MKGFVLITAISNILIAGMARIPLYGRILRLCKPIMYNGVRCIDLYGILKDLGVSSIYEDSSTLICWVSETVTENLCPVCVKSVKLRTDSPDQFVKSIDLDSYNLVHHVEAYYDGVEDFDASSIHIYKLGLLELTGHKKCLQELLFKRLRGF